jgi:hypothetical protein
MEHEALQEILERTTEIVMTYVLYHYSLPPAGHELCIDANTNCYVVPTTWFLSPLKW